MVSPTGVYRRRFRHCWNCYMPKSLATEHYVTGIAMNPLITSVTAFGLTQSTSAMVGAVLLPGRCKRWTLDSGLDRWTGRLDWIIGLIRQDCSSANDVYTEYMVCASASHTRLTFAPL